MSASDLSLDFTLQRLRQVRTQLLRLHKALLNSERVVYEQFHGRIQSNGEVFRLVIGHSDLASRERMECIVYSIQNTGTD